jgi:hypothetical protein
MRYLEHFANRKVQFKIKNYSTKILSDCPYWRYSTHLQLEPKYDLKRQTVGTKRGDIIMGQPV